MVLLRWMHLRKLVPLAELLSQGSTGGTARLAPPRGATGSMGSAGSVSSLSSKGSKGAMDGKGATAPVAPAAKGATAPDLKDALLTDIRAGKPFFYNTVVAQAQRIEVAGDRVTFVFSPTHRALREQFEQSRSWVEAMAERVAGRRVMVESAQGAAPAGPVSTPKSQSGDAGRRDLKEDARNSAAIQAMLEVFPAEIRDVEEMEP
jgi:hypothetical protein